MSCRIVRASLYPRSDVSPTVERTSGGRSVRLYCSYLSEKESPGSSASFRRVTRPGPRAKPPLARIGRFGRQLRESSLFVGLREARLCARRSRQTIWCRVLRSPDRAAATSSSNGGSHRLPSQSLPVAPL